MAYTKEILTLAVEIGDCMLRNGAEIYRVEDTVVHILSSYEVEEFDVYVLSNGIFARRISMDCSNNPNFRESSATP